MPRLKSSWFAKHAKLVEDSVQHFLAPGRGTLPSVGLEVNAPAASTLSLGWREGKNGSLNFVLF